MITPFSIPGKSTPHPGTIFPGASVTLHGIGKTPVIGLIIAVHPMDIMMTDLDGSERPWTGLMPVLDLVIIDPTGAGNIERGITKPWRVEPIIVSKACWQGDLERQCNFLGLPPMIVRTAPRYTTIDHVIGTM